MFEQVLNMFTKAPPNRVQDAGGPWAKFTPALQKAIGQAPGGDMGAQPVAPRKQGLAGFIQAAGDRAAKNMYGDQADAMRSRVWADLLGSIGDRMTAGGTLGQGLSDARAKARAGAAHPNGAEELRRWLEAVGSQPQLPAEPLVPLGSRPRKMLSDTISK